MAIDRIIAAESGGRADARNPRSSATGLGQFIESTWLSMIAKHRPDLAQGKSREEILALRTDPDLSRAMTEAYAAENAARLTGAGFEASPANTYLAHFAGPGGALRVLGADPSAPAGALLGDAAVTANPFLRGMTAGDLIAWAGKKMGAPMATGAPPSGGLLGASPAVQASAAPQAASSGLLGALPAAGDLSGVLGLMGGQAPQLPPPTTPQPYRPRINFKPIERRYS